MKPDENAFMLVINPNTGGFAERSYYRPRGVPSGLLRFRSPRAATIYAARRWGPRANATGGLE